MTKVGGLPIWYTGKQPRRKRRWSPSRQQKRHCAGVDKGRFFFQQKILEEWYLPTKETNLYSTSQHAQKHDSR